jgi:hypothetical protein
MRQKMGKNLLNPSVIVELFTKVGDGAEIRR